MIYTVWCPLLFHFLLVYSQVQCVSLGSEFRLLQLRRFNLSFPELTSVLDLLEVMTHKMRTSPRRGSFSSTTVRRPILPRLLRLTWTAKTKHTLQQRPAPQPLQTARTGHTRGIMTSQVSSHSMGSTRIDRPSMQSSTTSVRIQESAVNLRVCSDSCFLLNCGRVILKIWQDSFTS